MGIAKKFQNEKTRPIITVGLAGLYAINWRNISLYLWKQILFFLFSTWHLDEMFYARKTTRLPKLIVDQPVFVKQRLNGPKV
jgi:hypothetical protein